ncbi:hydroxymethylglutaryl-CoA synthase [Lactococcus nasutitermitis]|uniref:Hydroxymethylglutaryl-CoA synthase n=1 Tax=Lactococcus nasutitermitis TaxID=1652957 RepID=A0ABV9JAU3_9LACT|nr:hydroxymethylglutaryl-CoA synthase [Lactococcus nasutitermitis]
MKVGIDKLAFFVPNFYVDMTELAVARNVDPAKFHIGIGQDQMAVNPITEDIITLAANAAAAVLDEKDKQMIDMVIVGTESAVDESKASAVIVHGLLDIQPFARSIEIKEACYGATAGLALAYDHVRQYPEQKVLVIAADIAKYGLNTGGEPTQGAGAVAIVVSAAPHILVLGNDNVSLTQDVYDFWRPMGQAYPSVDGKFSNATYIDAFSQVWDEYARRTGTHFANFAGLVFHTPYTKMGKKAMLPKIEAEPINLQEHLLAQYEKGIIYNRRVGNLYTGSLYLSLISLLENSSELVAGDKLGLFSYGSGSVAEFFSAELVEGFAEHLRTKAHLALLDGRVQLSIDEYERMFNTHIDLNHNTHFTDDMPFSISEVLDNHRVYRK